MSSASGRPPDDDPVRTRVLEAAYACVARWGMAKTTVDDAAKEAGLSRATVYRRFPGGRDELLAAVIAFEVRRFFERMAGAVAGSRGLADVLDGALAFAHEALEEHVVLQQVLSAEPQLLVPRITEATNRLQPEVRAFLAPYLAAEAAHGRLREGLELGYAADVIARLALSFVNAEGLWRLGDRRERRELVALLLAGVLLPGAEER